MLATLAFERGVRHKVRIGLRALPVSHEVGRAVAHVVGEPSSHYYKIMTRSDRMPCLIGERV